MSNSPLVSYTKISPNRTSPRNDNIQAISIHHMAGNLSIEACGEVFANEDTEASSHYGIGSDGRIGQYVDEDDRAWCCSSRDVDHMAVTIEVADEICDPLWKPSKLAMDSLIDLCVDICQRNGIEELIWQEDEDIIDDPEEQNLIPHCYLAPTLCPGPYILERYGWIADEVNKRLRGEVEVTPHEKKQDNPMIVYNFLKHKDLSNNAIFGIMGNLYAESGFIPINLQNSFEESLHMTDESYTNKVDSGEYEAFADDGAGYGLAQWTYHTRKEKLLEYAEATDRSIGDIHMQLEFLWDELNNQIDMYALDSASSIREASDIILLEFERPADQSEAVQIRRAKYGEEWYNKIIGAGEQKEEPFNIEVTVPALNIRSGPGTGYDVVGTIIDKGIYGIEETADGDGADKWGRLSNGKGWISLDHTIDSDY